MLSGIKHSRAKWRKDESDAENSAEATTGVDGGHGQGRECDLRGRENPERDSEKNIKRDPDTRAIEKQPYPKFYSQVSQFEWMSS